LDSRERQFELKFPVSLELLDAPNVSGRRPRSDFSHYLPRLKREFYQADAVIFWTMPVSHRQQGWLTDCFHAAFRGNDASCGSA